jgi:hypothetical protein
MKIKAKKEKLSKCNFTVNEFTVNSALYQYIKEVKTKFKNKLKINFYNGTSSSPDVVFDCNTSGNYHQLTQMQ